jgi:putative transcriptional regulator
LSAWKKNSGRKSHNPHEKRKYHGLKLNPKKPPKTDWCAFDAMSEEDRHRAALSDADSPPATDAQLARGRVKQPSMSKMPTSSKTTRRPMRPMTQKQIEAAANADRDNRPLSSADLVRMKRTPQVKIIGRALGISQEDFAARCHVPLGTLRDWEQGRVAPDQAARAHLTVIARDPEAVRKALNPPQP